jgi:hypothetical protein
VSKRDHVAVFVVRDFAQARWPKPNYEIIAHGFFPPESLPEGTTSGTKARIAEVLAGQVPGGFWT